MEIHDAINVRGTKEIILTLSYLLQLNYFCRDLALQLNNWLPLFLEISPFKKWTNSGHYNLHNANCFTISIVKLTVIEAIFLD